MVTLSHCCRNPSIILALPIRVSASSPTPSAIYPRLPRPKFSPPWVSSVIVNMTPLRSFTLVLCHQICRCGLLYILLKYAKTRSRSTSFPFCFADLEDSPATTVASPLPFPTTESVFPLFWPLRPSLSHFPLPFAPSLETPAPFSLEIPHPLPEPGPSSDGFP